MKRALSLDNVCMNFVYATTGINHIVAHLLFFEDRL